MWLPSGTVNNRNGLLNSRGTREVQRTADALIDPTKAFDLVGRDGLSKVLPNCRA